MKSDKLPTSARVAISVPVHEKPEILRDQALNFGYFFPEALLIIHVSKSSNDSYESFIDATDGLSNVVFNPDRTVTRWGDALGPNFRNIRFALTELEGIDYVTFASSTDMMVKRGVFNYITKTNLAFNHLSIVESSSKSPIVQECFLDKSFQSLLNELGIDYANYSQIEGSFYSSSLMQQILPIIERHFDVYSCDAKYFREEFAFSTIAKFINNNNLKSSVGFPYTLRGMFAYNWARSFENHCQIINPLSRIAARILRIAYPSFWKLSTLTRSLQYDFDNLRFFAKCNNIEQFKPSSIYSIKRVNPDLNDPIRCYLRSQILN